MHPIPNLDGHNLCWPVCLQQRDTDAHGKKFARMSSAHSISTWIGQLKAGDAAAADRLWQRYYTQLVERARQHLSRNVRRMADEEDVALSAFADFCAGAATGRFPSLANRHDLWRLLLTITLRKAKKLATYEGQQRRDAARLAHATDLFDLPDADLDRLAGDAPDPGLAAEVADQLAWLLRALPDQDLRPVALDLLAGYTTPEIAQRRQTSQRTVERRCQRIRQCWGPLLQDP
jgi:DNA-directed RNA polymerase specialized sigma24 family protein